jgi:hypothetical protein
MFDLLPPVLGEVKQIVASLDPAVMTGVQAAAMVRDFAELERVAAAGRLLLAHRVEETRAWDRGGHRSAVEWMAAQTGGTLGSAKDALETSRNLADQPSLDEALRDGALSPEKAAAVSDAAKKAPGAEDELVGKAKHSPLGQVRDDCNQAKARGEDAAARAKRCHRNRQAWVGRERDGMVSLHATGPVAQMALVRAALEKRTDQNFRAHNRGGDEPEPRDRYAFDALVELLTGTGTATKTKTRVNAQVSVDITALRRGWAEAGEICDAPGVGELTVDEINASSPSTTHSSTSSSRAATTSSAPPAPTATSPPHNAAPCSSATPPASYPAAPGKDASKTTTSTATPKPDKPASTASHPCAHPTTPSKPVTAGHSNATPTAATPSPHPNHDAARDRAGLTPVTRTAAARRHGRR